MEGRISPVSSAGEEDAEEINNLLKEIIEDEVDINVHFHCEHCIKLNKCKADPKPGWSCEIINCPHNCGMRFHSCKLEEHDLLCSHLRVPCINEGYGCTLWMMRECISDHLPYCPASVVICTYERNRWLAGVKSREIVAPPVGSMSLFDANDLDVSLALYDQSLTNELQTNSARVMQFHNRTKRLPILPLHSDTTSDSHAMKHFRIGAESPPPEDNLVPGLSGSISTKLDKPSDSSSNSDIDEYSYSICIHGIHKQLCQFCVGDPTPPDKITKKVWRQIYAKNELGEMTSEWKHCEVVMKVKRNSSRALLPDYDCVLGDPEYESEISFKRLEYIKALPLDPSSLKLELTMENYSKAQTKPYNMITIQCLQLLRRNEFSDHVKTVHCDIMGDGIEGRMLVKRCPMMSLGCPYSVVVRETTSVCPQVQYDSKSGAFGLAIPTETIKNESNSEEKNYMNSISFNHLPLEITLHILSFLDGFSLGKVASTCWQLNSVCRSLVMEKGIVYQNWKRNQEGQGWHLDVKKWKFSNSLGCVNSWRFRDNFVSDISNHLEHCQYLERVVNRDKFSYGKMSADFLQKFKSLN